MLSRVLEPEVMDTADEARDYDAMDHSEVNARFVADFLEMHGPCRGGWLVDVGTGTARIPIALCQADPQARVVGTDLASAMLHVAGLNIARAGLGDRIRLGLADAKVVSEQTRGFEAVISNSIVHHIPEPRRVLEAMVRQVAPGGTLFVRDLARPVSLAVLEEQVARYGGAPGSEGAAMFGASLHAALTVDEISELAASVGLPWGCARMTSDRHWTLAWRAAPG
jgi:ubiquinone/menaquinone biosynthesis C-methylase UbiE